MMAFQPINPLNPLTFFSGDVETNPGPPKNKGAPGGRPKEPTKEEIMAAMKQKERDLVSIAMS